MRTEVIADLQIVVLQRLTEMIEWIRSPEMQTSLRAASLGEFTYQNTSISLSTTE